MITYEVKDMTCGHCVSTITKAVNAADKTAKVQIDLARHRVDIEPGEADAQTLGDAIREAGYTPVALGDAASVSSKRSSGGCCCG